MEPILRPLAAAELTRALFDSFIRRQEVTACWRRAGDRWVIRDDPFIDDWSEADYAELLRCLHRTVHTGGLVLGGFVAGALKGFVSVEAQPDAWGRLDLTSLHVSADLRGQGLGSALFAAAKAWARAHGARGLYLSTHSAAETQAFYRARGCRDTAHPLPHHVQSEPFDCQLECWV